MLYINVRIRIHDHAINSNLIYPAHVAFMATYSYTRTCDVDVAVAVALAALDACACSADAAAAANKELKTECGLARRAAGESNSTMAPLSSTKMRVPVHIKSKVCVCV
jgi:hypothetical protein